MKKDLQHFLNSAKFSYQGIKFACKETAFRQELIALIILVPVAYLVAPSLIWLAILWFSMFLVLAFELINTAVEAAIDRIGSEKHPLSGAAKDLGSACVAIALLNSAIMWILCIIALVK